MIRQRLIELGAVVASDVEELAEGVVPKLARGAAPGTHAEYRMIAAKTRCHEIRKDDPANLVARMRLYGGWAVVPCDLVGDAAMLLLEGVERFNEQKTEITVQPVTHQELDGILAVAGSD